MKRARRIFLACTAALCFCIAEDTASKGADVPYDRLNRLQNLSFIPQSAQLVSNCTSEPRGSIRFWSLEGGRLIDVVQFDENEFPGSLAVSESGDLITVETRNISQDQTIGCYSVKGKKWLWKEKWLEGLYCNKVQFASGDKEVIAVGARSIVLYDTETAKILRKHTDPLSGYPPLYYSPRQVALSPSSRYIVIWQETLVHKEDWWRSKGSKWVTVWDLEDDRLVARWKKMRSGICSATFSSDEKSIIFGGDDGYVRVLSVAEGRLIKEWRAHWITNHPEVDHLIDFLAVSKDGRFLASSGRGDKGYNVKIWNYATGSAIHEFSDIAFNPGACGGVYPMAFSPDGKFFALEKIGRLCLFDTQTWDEKWCTFSWPEDKDINSSRK